ncbi:MAG: phage tail tape measure protein [Lachnospiraceae bacterium]|jgi:TP901 family phage tail tape measure protein|nr:phage tail tape measure protein [Lachnospiraceae bacterium]
MSKNVKEQIPSYLYVGSGFSAMISKTKDAIKELKEIDHILTQISKTSNLTSRELEELGNTAIQTAGKYGRDASDYLTSVKEMYHAGFSNADAMAELSILTQSAGDLPSGTADSYLIATNAAYGLQGNIEKLNDVLDSQTYITSHTAVSMKDMALATSEAAAVAAQYRVEIDELSALTTVAVSKTGESGSEVGNALKNIFANLQDSSSQPIQETFDSLGLSMTKFVNDVEVLKSPIELLEELSRAFVSLPDGSVLKSDILSNIGSENQDSTLAAILSDFDRYYEILDLYGQGSGAAMDAAMKSANDLSASLSSLGNTWTSIVNNVIGSDALIGAVNGLRAILNVVETLTSALGSFGTIGLGAGLFAGIKNVGSPKMFGLKNVLLFANTDSMSVLPDTAVSVIPPMRYIGVNEQAICWENGKPHTTLLFWRQNRL